MIHKRASRQLTQQSDEHPDKLIHLHRILKNEISSEQSNTKLEVAKHVISDGRGVANNPKYR